MVRPATIADSEAIAGVIVAAQGTWAAWVGAEFRTYEQSELERSWTRRLVDDATVAYVAIDEGQVVGVGAGGPESQSYEPSQYAASSSGDASAHLSTLFVLPEHHGRGIGSVLHNQVLADLGGRGYTTVRLWAPQGAYGARRFYARNGWAGTGSSTCFAGLERLELRRSLG